MEVTQRAKEAEKIKEMVSKVKDKAERIVATIETEKGIAEEKLEAAKPALQEAEEALNTIKPANIATVRKLGRPPHLIMRVMDCVIILFRRLEKRTELFNSVFASIWYLPSGNWQL